MTLGIGQDAQVGLETLSSPLSHKKVVENVLARPATLERSITQFEKHTSSSPELAVPSRQYGRWLKTTAPLVLADLISLALAGIIAHYVVRWIYHPAATPLDWLAPFALIPLALAYGLSDSYSE